MDKLHWAISTPEERQEAMDRAERSLEAFQNTSTDDLIEWLRIQHLTPEERQAEQTEQLRKKALATIKQLYGSEPDPKTGMFKNDIIDKFGK